eukprot:TRINITY_DN1027_c0_g1_i1.p1 TRINITY_DN1027_c0_g1~~TRINITY_DN1027_c0_g1_i1.p1  ORF type:complete len:160 (+),score=46.70 TRINITY_DN1027_c0_g1_i1:277-756(+)
MGRRGASSSSSFGKKPAPKPAPKPVAAPAKPTTPAPAPAQSHPIQPATPASAGGPGLLGQMAATMGGAMAGSVVGHAISHTLFGGSNNNNNGEVAQQTDATATSQITPAQQKVNEICAAPYSHFLKCVEKSGQDIAACQWAFDNFKDCEKNATAKSDYY